MPTVHPTAIVHDGARLGPGVEIGPYCIVGPAVELKPGVRLISHAVIEGVTEVGPECVVHPFAVLGGPPQHLAHQGEPTRLVIGAGNLIREHVTMHAGTAAGRGVTTVGSNGLYMVGAHVAHDCIVGDNVVFANNARRMGKAGIDDLSRSLHSRNLGGSVHDPREWIRGRFHRDD